MDDERKQTGADTAAENEKPAPEPTEPEKVDEPESPPAQTESGNTTEVTDPKPERPPVEDPKPEPEQPPESDTKPEESKPDKPKPEEMQAQISKLRGELLNEKAGTVAMGMGVAAGRASYVLRLADLSGIDATAEDAPAKIRMAVEKVLAEVPELKGSGTGSWMPPRTGQYSADGVTQAFGAALKGNK